jgi:hypothetical protein
MIHDLAGVVKTTSKDIAQNAAVAIAIAEYAEGDCLLLVCAGRRVQYYTLPTSETIRCEGWVV